MGPRPLPGQAVTRHLITSDEARAHGLGAFRGLLLALAVVLPVEALCALCFAYGQGWLK